MYSTTYIYTYLSKIYVFNYVYLYIINIRTYERYEFNHCPDI